LPLGCAHRVLHSFPTRRSSDLTFAQAVDANDRLDGTTGAQGVAGVALLRTHGNTVAKDRRRGLALGDIAKAGGGTMSVDPGHIRDRKSTRLNSSHVKISYAVFC